jgi:hypothetical protein
MATLCPKCHDSNIRRSHRRLFDVIFRSIGMVPLRCNLCEHRFYRLRRQIELPSSMRSAAPGRFS